MRESHSVSHQRKKKAVKTREEVRTHRLQNPLKGRIEKKELNLLAMILLSLVAWFTIGIQVFNAIATAVGPVIAYGLLVAIYVWISAKTRNRYALIVIAVLISADIVTPPIQVPWSGATELQPEQALAADYAVYRVYSFFGLSHHQAYIATYILTPFLVALFVVVTLKAGQSRKMLKQGLG